MFRTASCLVAALLLAGSLHAASAQSTTEAKPSKVKLTMQKLKDMKAKWTANKPRLKACRAEMKSKGLTGDDRWFYIEECMGKS